LRFQSLASSSAGNAYVVDDGNTRLLLECGMPIKKLQKALGFSLSSVAACFVTHEHKDHCRAVKQVLDQGVPVYCSPGTAQALDDGRLCPIVPREAVTVGSFRVMAFSVFHDAAEPVGYLLQSEESGQRLLFATDTVNLQWLFTDLHQIALECNYERALLDTRTEMPEVVRQRVMRSHMEIGDLCSYLKRLDLSRVGNVYLLHLSDACSNERDFVRRVQELCPTAIVEACAR